MLCDIYIYIYSHIYQNSKKKNLMARSVRKYLNPLWNMLQNWSKSDNKKNERFFFYFVVHEKHVADKKKVSTWMQRPKFGHMFRRWVIRITAFPFYNVLYSGHAHTRPKMHNDSRVREEEYALKKKYTKGGMLPLFLSRRRVTLQASESHDSN